MDMPPFTLLVIDDAQDDHALYQAYLGNDYRIVEAYNGEEGLALFSRQAFDCVLLDYVLPDTDGIEMLRRLRSMNETVPIIMLTGEGSESLAVITMKIGAQDYLPKSILTTDTLKRSIHRAMERMQLLQRLETYRCELERSNEDLERFAHVVAHDLKSPLRAITQHLYLIAEHNPGLNEKSQKSMQFAIDGAERMRRLIDGLFEFSKAGFEKCSLLPVSCAVALESVIANLASEIAEKHAVISSEPLPMVMADSMQLIQLLQNLIANALKFCEAPARIHVSAQKEGRHWAISIKDNGIGIPPSAQEKIFIIFKRLHSEQDYPGCGIGLAVCDRIVKNHGGSIHVESQPGEGATFIFTLPECTLATQEKAA